MSLRESIYRCLWSFPVWFMGIVIASIITVVVGSYSDKIIASFEGVKSDFVNSGEILTYVFCFILLGILLLIFSMHFLRSKNPTIGKNEKTGATMSKYTINQSHSGSGDNIVADKYIGQKRFELTESLMEDIVSQLDVAKPVSLIWRDRGRGSQIKNAIKSHLLQNNFSIIGDITIDKATGFNPDKVISGHLYLILVNMGYFC